MNAAAELVRLKLQTMGEQIKFLEYVWDQLVGDQEFYINNYQGKVPEKYKFNK